MPNLIFNILLAISLSSVLIAELFKLEIPIVVIQTIAYIALIPVIIAAYKSIRKKEVSVDFLAAVALITAFIAKEWISAIFISLMLSCARIFDIWTSRKSDQLIKSLLKYRPKKVKVKIKERVEIKNVEDIEPGDILIIGTGERIAVDGIIIDGQASIDEATLTGESIPIAKKVGDKVFSSTLNISGSILVKTEKKADESTLAQIITMVEKSTLKKSKTVKTASIFAKWYILATFLAAIAIFLITKNINFVLAILLVVCADDIAVATPLAFTVAISKAARFGILIKSSDVLERLSKIDVFITDKTGTLTLAKPKIVKFEIFDNKLSYKNFIRFLVTAEVNSNHPIAKEITELAKSQNIGIPAITKSKESPGEGVEVQFDNKNIIAGKIDFLIKNNIKITTSEMRLINKYSNNGYSTIAMGVDKDLKGIVIFEDSLRPSAINIVQKTKKLGAKLWIMLTGDNKMVAKKIANDTGIDVFESDLMPKDKLNYIENYKKKNKEKTIAMIGDGVNDAAALAIADISFAMGVVGSDTAINAADVALMDDNLEKISKSIILGKKTHQVIYLNFAFWAITNLIGLGLVFSHVLSPTGAATYNFLTDFLPIANALSINWFGEKKHFI